MYLQDINETEVLPLAISSSAFSDNGNLPRKYTYEGDNVNPPINISDLPENTRSLVLIVDGLDKSSQRWTHWLVWNIQPCEVIKENSVPGIQGLNDFWEHNYEGPCPPKGRGKYFFRVFALSGLLYLTGAAKREDIESAMEGKILASGQIMAQYNWH